MIAAAERLSTLPEGLPARTLGWEALAWAAHYLKHPNGIRKGLPWKFTTEQARFVLWFYAVDDQGRFIYSEAHRRLAKGSGKSPFAATMAIIEFLAPVRFKAFDPSRLGGVIGQPVSMPWVQIAAVSEKQTENTMRMVRAMVNKRANPRLHEDYDLDTGKTQINLVPEGKLEVITSSAASAEGSEITFCIGDELEHWTPANGGVELYNTLVDNLTKSGSRMLGTLNAWMPGINSVGEHTFTAWCLQEDGHTKNDTSILMDVRQAPPTTDLADAESLRAGLEFVYADCPWADIDAIMKRIWQPNTRPDDAKRKYLNWPTASMDAWCDPKDWAQMASPETTVEAGDRIALFFDGSLSRDTTALIGCRIDDGHVFTLGTWDPGNAHNHTGQVDTHAVDQAVQKAFDTYEIAAFFADVREWESFTRVIWPERYKDTLELWAVPNGANASPIAWDMRSKLFDFTRACELAEREILDHAFTHDGNPTLATHVINARRAENRYGIAIKKESPNSAKKIDAAVCMIGARMVRQRVLEAEPATKHTGRALFL